VDRLTYQPITRKTDNMQYTTESLKKSEKFNSVTRNEQPVIETEFDKMVDKGNDSLLAIIYIDGNNMGSKVKRITENKNDYTSGINALREFSKTTDNDFVRKPIAAITERLTELYEENKADENERKKYLFRPVISGGDEITIVCNAHAVVDIIETYFSTLTAESENSSCAGIAVFHSHDPFADVYRIAEQCCECGKEISHLAGNGDNNYIDFHFCHAGITNSLDVIRKTQEKEHTARPYEYRTTWREFVKYGNLLSQAKRSDIKALGESIVKGDSYYREELARIKSRDKENKLAGIYRNPDKAKKYIFDISIIFDLWFADKEQNYEQN
jgi:CRISPR/Cas system-associated protein Cas10 (large subunit of type III CRISPR-Cas system)